MRITSTGPAIFKLHYCQAPHKVSCPEYFACVHTHCLAFCILWRFFTLLPTTTSYPALDWLGRCSSRTPCKEGQTALLTTAGKHEGALRAPNLSGTRMSHHWSAQRVSTLHHWSTPNDRSSRSAQSQSAWEEELSENPSIRPVRFCRPATGCPSLNGERSIFRHI